MLIPMWSRKNFTAALMCALTGFAAVLTQNGAAAADIRSMKDVSICGCESLTPGPVQGLAAAYPQGGHQFGDGVITLISSNPRFVLDVICVARSKNANFKLVAAQAVAHAQVKAARMEGRDADAIAAMVKCADPEFQSAYYTAQMTGKLTTVLVPYVPDGPGGGAVSNSRP
jgi:hypothetical protein